MLPLLLPHRYRNQYGSDAMVHELEMSQNAFAPALLETQQKLSAQVRGGRGAHAAG